MPVVAASPIIVFFNKETEVLQEQISNLKSNLNRIRLRSFGSVKIFRQTDEDGKVNVSCLNNKLHRCGVKLGYYFTNPVLVNYDNAITKEEIEAILTKLRYVDCGRIHVVQMDTTGAFKLSLKINRNLAFETFENIELDVKTAVGKGK